MTLTRDFKETVQARVRRDAAFRKELVREGVECLLSGDVETGKAALGSRFIEEPMQAHILDLTAQQAKAQNQDRTPEEIQEAIKEALDWSRTP